MHLASQKWLPISQIGWEHVPTVPTFLEPCLPSCSIVYRAACLRLGRLRNYFCVYHTLKMFCLSLKFSKLLNTVLELLDQCGAQYICECQRAGVEGEGVMILFDYVVDKLVPL